MKEFLLEQGNSCWCMIVINRNQSATANAKPIAFVVSLRTIMYAWNLGNHIIMSDIYVPYM